jgi:predicted phosphodiesterase
VEYGPADRLGSTAISVEHGLISNHRTSHVIRLTGLSPGTTYRYRVVSREFVGYEKQYIVKYGETISSEVFSFTTFDDRQAACSFAMVSDIHENAKRLDALLALLDLRALGFMVFNGDMVNDFMSPDQPFTGFLDLAVARFARTMPLVSVRGNHDVRGRYARLLNASFPLPTAARISPSMTGRSTSWSRLGRGQGDTRAHNSLVAFEPYRREQAQWLAGDLRSNGARRARYRVVLSHIPPYGGDTFAIQDVRQAWEGIANQGSVDLWLSGHVHRYMRFDPARGKNRYQLVVGAPDTVMRVDASSNRLAVTVTRETGEKVDSLVLRPR